VEPPIAAIAGLDCGDGGGRRGQLSLPFSFGA